MRRLLIALATIASLLLAPRDASAAWPQPGSVVAHPHTTFIYFSESKLIAAPDGSVVALGCGSTASSEYWDSQRAAPSGDLTPAWPGLLTFSTPTTNGGPGVLARMGFGFSTGGDLLASWADGSATIWHQRMVGYGDPAPSLLDRSFTNPLSWGVYFTGLAPAAGNEVYLYYGNGQGSSIAPRLMRRAADGSVSPGWPVNGKRVFFAQAWDGTLLPDGAGGVIASERTPGFEFRVNRVAADTAFAAGWSSAGLLLNSNVSIFDEQPFPQLLTSGASGYLACWSENQPSTSPPTRELSMKRFLSNGTVDPAWPADGVKTSFTSSTPPRFAVIPDGAGGAFVLFERAGEPRGTHVLVTGVVDPAIGGADAPLLDPGAQYIAERECCAAPVRVPLVGCQGKNGGLIFVWADGRTAPQGSLRARWLTSGLQPDPSEPATPRLIPTTSATKNNVRAAIPDGFGGLYVAWEDQPVDSVVLVMNRVLASEFLAAPPAPRPSAMALSAPRPNPARDAVSLDLTLPDDSPARVELLDIAGRVSRAQLVSGAGSHAIAFDRLSSLSPGLYFVRAVGRTGSRTVRLAVNP